LKMFVSFTGCTSNTWRFTNAMTF